MKKIVCVGSATIDVLVKSNDLKVLKSHQVSGGVALCEVYGGKTETDQIVWETGGSAVNVAKGLTRLGNVCSVIARLGKDEARERILTNLKLEGVDVSLIQEDESLATAMSVVLIANDGGRSIITSRGASSKIESRKINWEKVASANWMQIGSLGGNISLINDLIFFSKSKNIEVGWNPGKGELMQKETMLKILPKIDLLTLNRMEAAQFLRHSYDEIKEMGRKFVRLGVKRVAITDGPEGAGLASGDVWTFASAFRVTAVDETGAGDAFTAGLVAGIVGGKSLEVSLRMGMANSASQVTILGAGTGMLRRNEMAKWLRRRMKMVEEKL